MADLESHLDVRLTERPTRTLHPAREGELLAARAGRLLGEAEDIRRAQGDSGGSPRGNPRLAVPRVIGSLLAGPIAARFRAAHPEMTLEIHLLDRSPDLKQEGFDG